MNEKAKIKTHFAPAERESMDLVWEQYRGFVDNKGLTRMLNSISVAVLILNQKQQAIYVNKAMLRLVGTTRIKSLIGLRVGEAIGCIHSDIMEAGCGTTEYCKTCGAARAILSGINGKIDDQECRITLRNAHAIDLRIVSSPLKINEQFFTVLSIQNIASQKRKEVLERVFLHDVKNTAGGLHGFSSLLISASEDQLESYKQIIHDLSDRLIDEINSYSQLAMAENNKLGVYPELIGSMELLNHVRNLYLNHEVAVGKFIQIDPASTDLEFKSDRTLLGRVLGNMVKNALEASAEDKVVTLSTYMENTRIRLSVHNAGVMPESSRLQVFRRSFSTKGGGRGIGTYSIKLFTEKYLKGKAEFSSTEEGGTTFFVWLPLDLEA